MRSREQFEAWYLENWGHTEDDHETLFERDPDSDEEYYRLGVRMSHQAWQAATNAMEAKCAALAADNEKAMEAMRQADEVVKRAHSKFSALADENMALRSAIENGMAAPETPATDAWKAEVLAQGVDMAACALDGVNQFNYANMLDDLAQKLRQDANTAELVAAGIITKVGE